LYKAGRRDLPVIAAAYGEANNCVAGTGGVSEAMRGAEPFGGTAVRDAFVQLRDAFVQLRDDVQTILGRGSVALNETGQALCRAAETYAGADAEAMREMKLIGNDLAQVPRPSSLRPLRRPTGGPR